MPNDFADGLRQVAVQLAQLFHQGPSSGSAPTTPNSWNQVPPMVSGASAQPVAAMSRFTRDPVTITPREMTSPDDQAQADPVIGATYGTAGQGHSTIFVSPDASATYGDLQHVLTHEQIHSLLNRMSSGYSIPRAGDNVFSPSNWDIAHVEHGYAQANRSGGPTDELPAYMGAFSPRDVPGVTQKQADTWNKYFRASLPPDISSLLQRIIQSQQSQRP